MKKQISFALAIGAVVLMASPVRGEVLYNLTSLDGSDAWSINNSGQIVGYSGGHAALFDPTGGGNHIDLGTPGERYSLALSINDSGQIVGESETSFTGEHATLFDPTGGGNNINLGSPREDQSMALSINNSGQIVGFTLTENFELYATLFDPTGGGNNINLGGDASMAVSINNSGQIVGESGGHAALFDPTGGGNHIDLGTQSSLAWSINDSGQIVGSSNTASFELYATLFDPTGGGNNIDLGSLEGLQSMAYSINNSGQIVGEVFNRSGYYRATLFDPTGGGNNIDLNNLIYPDLGWELTSAKCINDKGYIVGRGHDPNGHWRAYLLTPIKPVTLIGIEIVGPNEVADNFSASYKAIAHYDNNNTGDVTVLAAWTVEPNMYASIETGLLTTKDTLEDQSVTVGAGYTEGDLTVEDDKVVDILAICPTGTALQFDGVDDYLDCGSDPSLDVTELTWSLWIKRAETTCINERALISNEGGGENTGGTYALQIDVGGQYQDKIQFVRHGDDVKNCPLSETAIQDTNWHHVAVTRKINRDVMVYIDGMLDAKGTIGTRTEFTKTVIGAGHTSYSNFNGTIDDVRIYNRALSAEEIQANMHDRLTGDELGLVGYWDFDEGVGQIVYDLSGNNNHGQLGSTPDIDESEPAWVKSDAPIGICTPYLIATMMTERALERKSALLEEFHATLAQESTAYEALEEWLESAEFGDFNKGDIVTAKQRIHSAIRHEVQSIDTLEKSIEKLEDALSALGYEPALLEPNQPPSPTPSP